MTKPLRLEDDAVQQCVAFCDQILVNLDEAIAKTKRFGEVSGFGGFDSAQQLQAGFQRKLQGTPESIRERLFQFQEVIEQMRAMFIAGGEGFAEAELANMQALATIQGGVDA